jgi:hypothetical protein
VNKAATTTTITADTPDPSVVGQAVTVTYAVTVTSPGSGTSTGNVTVSDGTVSCTGTVAAGSCSLTFTSAGTKSLTATYAGDTNFNASTSAPVPHIVNKAATTTAVSSSPNPSVFGQTVTFTAAVSAVPPGAGTRTGTVQFSIDGSPFGSPATVAAGAASITTSSLLVGSHTATAVYSGDGNFFGSNGTLTPNQVINQAPTATTVTVSPNPQQYSDKATLVATVSPNQINNLAPVSSVTFFVGTQNMGTVSTPTTGGGVLTFTLADIPLLEPPFPGNGQMAPGARTATATFGGVNPNFSVANPTTTLTIAQEDARAYYTGALFASTSSVTSSTATVTLSATVRDITAETADLATDAYAGDIRKAVVTFVNRDTNVVLCTPTVGLVSPSDTKTGTATCSWTANIGASDSVQYTIGVMISGYYLRNDSAENTVLTVSKPLSNFITGGGYLVLANSAGQKAGDSGTKNNFGFSVKYNKQGTNLQGRINTIIRRTEIGVLRTYQIKGNAMTSLAVQPPLCANAPCNATFNGQASIQDITNPLSPISVDGNATLQVTMTDNGEPGSADTIGVTVWNKSGGLWSSSRWNGTKTTEQGLGGGNLVVH